MVARISKILSNTFETSQQPLVIDEVKFTALQFPNVTLAVTSNDTIDGSIDLNNKNCTLQDGTRVTCATINACVKYNGAANILEAIGNRILVYTDLRSRRQRITSICDHYFLLNFQQMSVCTGSSMPKKSPVIHVHECYSWMYSRRGPWGVDFIAVLPFIFSAILSNVIRHKFMFP